MFVKSLPKAHGSLRVVVLVFVAMTLLGCEVLSVEGPASVALGELVRYTVSVESIGIGGTDVVNHLIATVPEGWSLVSSTYAGTGNGQTYSGMGTVIPPSPVCDMDEPPPEGFQKLIMVTETFDAVSATDVGMAEVVFRVGGALGSHQLQFRGVATTPEGNACWNTVSFDVEVMPALFADDFETGNVDGWAFAVGQV